ncbi:MAG: hypothetical protein ACT4QF_13265 [Sporichthyaceae bacterium]
MGAEAEITIRPDEALLADIAILLDAGAKDRASANREAVRAAARNAVLRRAAEDAERLANDPDDRAEVAIVRGLFGVDSAW